MNNGTTHALACEYCQKEFHDRYTADEDKSRHKAQCQDRRYLGGALTSEEF